MRTTIFYENSGGFLKQFNGEILEITQTTISVKISSKKAYKLDLKANSDFLIVCKKRIKPIEALNNENYKNYWTCFDEQKRHEILSQIEKDKNILHYWDGTRFLQ
jgi:hypothetical protein